MISGKAEAIVLLLSTVTHFALILLPCLATCAFVVRKGVQNIVVVGLVALVTIGLLGYLAFWLWFLSPQLGRIFALLLPFAATLFLIWTFPRLDTTGQNTLKALTAPTGLVAAAALLVVSIGFMFGGLNVPSTTAQIRFSHTLPADNILPFLFEEGIRIGRVPKPLLGDWRSSDRPPLQTGIILSQGVYLLRPRALQYTIISVIVQSLWIFALWLFLAAFDLDPRAIALALAVCLFSGFVFLNSFYVWPKLLAGAYMLAASAVFLPDRFAAALRSRISIPLLGAALATFGLLAHGGSAFAVIGLVLTMVLIRRRVSVKSLVTMGITCICLYLPWMLYQRLYDPPGDRLVKWHLTGVGRPDSRPFLQLLTSAYTSLTFHQYLDNKLANVQAAADHQAEYWHNMLELFRRMARSDATDKLVLAQTAATLRALCFFFFVPALGFLVIGPISLILGIYQRCRSPEWKVAAVIWFFVVLTMAIWCFLLFIPSMTVIHTSTYAMVLLSFAGSILALWAVSPWLAVVVGSLQIEINFLLYISFMPAPVVISSLDKGLLRFATVTLAVLSLICTLFLLRNLAKRQTREPKT